LKFKYFDMLCPKSPGFTPDCWWGPCFSLYNCTRLYLLYLRCFGLKN